MRTVHPGWVAGALAFGLVLGHAQDEAKRPVKVTTPKVYVYKDKIHTVYKTVREPMPEVCVRALASIEEAVSFAGQLTASDGKHSDLFSTAFSHIVARDYQALNEDQQQLIYLKDAQDTAAAGMAGAADLLKTQLAACEDAVRK